MNLISILIHTAIVIGDCGLESDTQNHLHIVEPNTTVGINFCVKDSENDLYKCAKGFECDQPDTSQLGSCVPTASKQPCKSILDQFKSKNPDEEKSD